MIRTLIIAALLVATPSLAASPGANRVLGVAEGGTGTPNGPAAVPFAAPGAVSAASILSRAGHNLNVIDDFGAKGDGQWRSMMVTCASGSQSIAFARNGSNAAPAFSSADVGKIIAIPGCGGAYWAYGPVAVVSGGSGYVYGEDITLAGGTGLPVHVRVTQTSAADKISAGAVVAAVLYHPGRFSVAPVGTLGQSATSNSGSGATFALTGFQSALSGTILAVASASQITVSAAATASQSAAARVVSYGTDDQPAFAAAIAAMVARGAGGGRIHAPTPSGMGYALGSPIVLPGQGSAPYQFAVELYGDGPSTVLRSVGVMNAQIETDAANFNRQHEVHHFTLDGAAMAVHNYHHIRGGDYRIHHNHMLNAASGGSNLRMDGDQENFVTDNYIRNDQSLISADKLPTYNQDVGKLSTDNQFINNTYWNASHCNSWDSGANNHFTATHAYGYANINQSDYYPAVANYCVNSQSVYVNNVADGSIHAGYYVTAYGATLTGNKAQLAAVGVEIAQGVQGVGVFGNFFATDIPKAILQNGAPGQNTFVFGNVGAAPVYSSIGPVVSAPGSTVAANAAGYLGGWGVINGAQSFGVGNNARDNYMIGALVHSAGQNVWQGDAQTVDLVMRGSGVSGTVNILTTGSGPAAWNSIIRLSQDYPAIQDLTVNLRAFCSTMDYAKWTARFGLAMNKTASTVKFEGASGLTTTPPTFTQVTATPGASSWVPAVVLDAANGGAYFTGTGACTGGKTIYWVADVHIVEAGSGAN